MKKLLATLTLISCLGTGCAINRPVLSETIKNPDGSVTERRLKITTFALGSVKQAVADQKATLGKTLGVGQASINQETSGTNLIRGLELFLQAAQAIHP